MAQSGSGTGGAGKDLGRWEGRENSPVGGGGDPRAFPGLPPVLVQPPIGLNLSWCLWKALPKVSQNRLGFFRSAQLHLSLTHTPFWAQRGGVVRRRVRRAASQLPCAPGSLLWFPGIKTLSPPSITPARKAPVPPTHLVSGEGGSLGGRQPRGFPLSVCARPELGRRLGKEVWERRDNSPRARAQRSLIQVFAGARLRIQSTGVPGSICPSPHQRASAVLESSWEASEILPLSKSWDALCVSDSARTEANAATYSGRLRTWYAEQRPGSLSSGTRVW